MRIDGIPYRTIWLDEDGWSVRIIDQTLLPHRFETERLTRVADAARAIRTMQVRGAPLIGASAAYGVALAMRQDPSYAGLTEAIRILRATRPTAVNLSWALGDMEERLRPLPEGERLRAAYQRASEICNEDVEINRRIGEHGLALLRKLSAQNGDRPVNVLTHCNAGWLATVDWGTATAAVYLAHDEGIPVHVWVDETRPRNQGASLTAWELGRHGVPHRVVADNTGGHLMQHGLVDLVLTGTDRTTATGDVANKIGTYLKALAARDNGVPFYAAVPSPSIDWSMEDGVRDIPIEERDGTEVSRITGLGDDGQLRTVRLTPAGTPVANYAFDVTPARLVTGLITERGIASASRAGLLSLFPERGADTQR